MSSDNVGTRLDALFQEVSEAEGIAHPRSLHDIYESAKEESKVSDERTFEPKDFLFPGQRVTLNPDSQYYGTLKGINDDVNGYVVRTPYGDNNALVEDLRHANISRMQVHVRFDNGRAFDIRVEDLFPVDKPIQEVKKYVFDRGFVLYSVNGDNQDEIEEHIFYEERELLRTKTYDESFKQDILDKVQQLREQPEQDDSPFEF